MEGVAFGGPDELMLKRIMGLTCSPAFPPVVDGGVKGWEALRRQCMIPGNGRGGVGEGVGNEGGAVWPEGRITVQEVSWASCSAPRGAWGGATVVWDIEQYGK